MKPWIGPNPYRLFIFLQFFGSIALASATEIQDLPLNASAFFSRSQAWWRELSARPRSGQRHLGKGEAGFLPLTSLLRGQDEVSVDNIAAKMEEKLGLGDISWRPASAGWELGHDGGKSSVPLNDPIQLIRGPQGYVVADGHHDLFLALYLKAETIAVEVKEDLARLSPLEFWKEMKDRKLVYLSASAEELAKNPPEMFPVRDNPNRYLASLLALKASVDGQGAKIAVKKSKGPKAPVWVKVNNSVPFIEFLLARILAGSGINYESGWGKEPPAEIVEKARLVLQQAQLSGRYPELKEILVFPSRDAAISAAKEAGKLEDVLKIFAKEGCAGIFRRLKTVTE